MSSKVDRDAAIELFNELETALREHYRVSSASQRNEPSFQKLLRSADKLKCFLIDDFESLWYMDREDRRAEPKQPPNVVSTAPSVYEPHHLAPAGQGSSSILNNSITPIGSGETTPARFNAPQVSPVQSMFEI